MSLLRPIQRSVPWVPEGQGPPPISQNTVVKIPPSRRFLHDVMSSAYRTWVTVHKDVTTDTSFSKIHGSILGRDKKKLVIKSGYSNSITVIYFT